MNNDAVSVGGGIFVFGNPADRGAFSVRLERLSVQDNIALDGGGGWIQSATVTFVTPLLEDNFAEDDGGGLYLWQSTTTIDGGQVLSNEATGGGGGVFSDRGTLVSIDAAWGSSGTAFDNDPDDVYLLVPDDVYTAFEGGESFRCTDSAGCED